ncbi:MAG: Membrane-bound metal-dependent hydrolase [Symbiobacteriaceae bacterium]|nr:Membrane-bound metal-dependent hydrolase [Symbiobacteriaceae bacterium]
MDNITHGLLGIAIGMLRRRDGGPEADRPLSPTDKAVAWATFAAAELPDADVFIPGNAMTYLDLHRSWTHAVALAPVVAAIATLGTKLVWKQAKASTVYCWSLASVLVAHLFNDWLTGWGTRLLLPFSYAKLGLDWVPIVDLLFLVPLAAAVWLARRTPARRRRYATAVLAFLAIYAIGYRGIAHTLSTRQVARQYEGQSVARLQVSPNLFNPLGWTYAIDLGDRYEQGAVYPWGVSGPAVATAKAAPDDKVVAAVRNAPEVKPFFDHFKFPHVTYESPGEGYIVTLSDIRYKMRGGGMTYKVTMTPDLRVSGVK